MSKHRYTATFYIPPIIYNISIRKKYQKVTKKALKV